MPPCLQTDELLDEVEVYEKMAYQKKTEVGGWG
jgi:hypothetical protein